MVPRVQSSIKWVTARGGGGVAQPIPLVPPVGGPGACQGPERLGADPQYGEGAVAHRGPRGGRRHGGPGAHPRPLS